MRLLADENIPREAVELLRGDKHDVAWVAETAASISDSEVLAWSVREDRVLVTMDKDFGELAFRSKLPATSGIVLVRVPPLPGLVAGVLLKELGGGANLAGMFTVIEVGGKRTRALP